MLHKKKIISRRRTASAHNNTTGRNRPERSSSEEVFPDSSGLGDYPLVRLTQRGLERPGRGLVETQGRKRVLVLTGGPEPWIGQGFPVEHRGPFAFGE